MIHLDKKYAECLKALEAAGLLEWEGNREPEFPKPTLYRLSRSDEEFWPWQAEIRKPDGWWLDRFMENHWHEVEVFPAVAIDGRLLSEEEVARLAESA